MVDRTALLELIVLAAIAGEHVLVIGPPGTAKSEAARRISKLLGGRYFEYLLGRFTEPAEIFGPIDLQKLRAGVVETNVRGMLPEAEVAFLDEVFRGSTAILNALLSILNERKFHGGTTIHEVPLRVCIGASNELPSDESLAAFADRFLIQIHVEPVSDALLEELLATADRPDRVAATERSVPNLGDLDALRDRAGEVSLTQVRPALADAVRVLRLEGIELSDRRIVRIQRLLGAAAALDDRDHAELGDLWPIFYAIPGADQQQRARELLRDRLANSTSASLPAAAELASSGPLVRAARLLESGRALLEDQAPTLDAASINLRLEGIAREIDASFHRNQRPAELDALRQTIIDHLADRAEQT